MTDSSAPVPPPPPPEEEQGMKIDPSRAAALVSQIGAVRERVAAVAKGRNVSSFFSVFSLFSFSHP